MTKKISFCYNQFIGICDFGGRSVFKNAGFKFDPELKHWYTKSARVAYHLYDYCDSKAKKEIKRILIIKSKWERPLSIPPNEELKDFQIETVKFALERNKAYIALDPGLGKTPIAAVIAQTLYDKKPCDIIVICPPFLKFNIQYEFERWAPRIDLWNLFILPDTQLDRELGGSDLENIIRNNRRLGRETILFIDEAHRFSNPDAKRTKALFGLGSRHHFKTPMGIVDYADRIYPMSGSPLRNRPIELYPMLSKLAPETIDFMTRLQYGKHYCAGFRNGFGWDFRGASNIPELVNRILDNFMLRIYKKDVLKELPQKIEETIIIGETLSPSLLELEQSIETKYSYEDLMEGRIKDKLKLSNDQELHLSTYRKHLGIHKAMAAIDFLKHAIEGSETPIIIFAIHKEVFEILVDKLSSFNPLIIVGDTPMQDRDKIVKEFQKGKHKLFLGNIKAAGLGLTLTISSLVIMLEWEWTPSDNEQAMDRAHRIGQLNQVNVWWLAIKNSLDFKMLNYNKRKKKITEQL